MTGFAASLSRSGQPGQVDPGQKLIVDTTFHQRVTKTATGRLIGHRCKEAEAAKQHEIQPQLRARAGFESRGP